MGSKTYTPDAPHRADRTGAAPHGGRRGFSNAALAGLLGLLGLIGLLAMVQSGQLMLSGALPAKATSAKPAKAGAKGKSQKLFPRQAGAVANLAGARAEKPEPAFQRQPRRELYQALAQMDADAAADMLGELNADEVTELLLALRERDLARILEAAPPFEAAQWVADFLAAAPSLDTTATSKLAPVISAPGLLESAAESDVDSAGKEATQATSDSSSNQPESAPQEGAGADESALSSGNTAGNEQPELPPDTNTA